MWALVLKYGLAGLELLKDHWKAVLVALAVLLQVYTVHGWSKEHEALKTEIAAHKADVQSYKDAQKAAEKLASDEKLKLQQENKVKADAADKNYSALYATYRANLLRFQAYQSVPRQPSVSQPNDSPQIAYGPSEGSEVPTGQVMISLEDADICAVNTARLQAARDWALSLAH